MGDQAEEIERLKSEINHLKEINAHNEVYKEKFIDVIGKLSDLPSSTPSDKNNDAASSEIEDSIQGSEKLLNSADLIISSVVSTFKEMPAQAQQEVSKIREEGSSLIRRLELLEKRCDRTSSDAIYAINTLHELQQYQMIDQLLVHGLSKDFPRNSRGKIKNGREFSKFMAKKLKQLLPSVDYSEEEILHSISVSHPMQSRKNPANIMAIVKFSNRDMRNAIFFAKRDLKGSKVAITEHLTQNTQERLAEVKKLFGKHNVWTSQVKVKALVHHQTFVIPTIAFAYELKDWADNRATEPFAHANGFVYHPAPADDE